MTVKISNLPAATSAGSGDVIPIVQGGTTKKLDLSSAITANLTYDNATSGLTATDVQGAIDEVSAKTVEIDALADQRLREAFRKEKSTDVAPSLLLDFAGDKQLDPRITYSRASTATYYDGQTVAKAEENLLLNSQDYSSEWTVTDLTAVTSKTAPDGNSTATEFTASSANGTLTQSVTARAGDHTFSVWLRRVTGTGDVDITAHSGGTWVTQTLTANWQRFDVTQTLTAGARTPGIRVVTSGDVIEVWGAQLEQRSNLTAYTPTTTQPITNYIPVLQTAASGAPRFDHDPITGESKGLLIEEQRTNYDFPSEQGAIYLSNHFGSIFGVNTFDSDLNAKIEQSIAPDGSLTALQLTWNNVGERFGTPTLKTSQHIPDGNVNATISIWAKSADTNNHTLDLVLRSTSVSNIATTSITVTPEWQRFHLSSQRNAGDGSTGWYLNANGTQNIFVWGWQLEIGSFPTSYIKTEGSQVTRVADSATMTGTNFSDWYRPDQGTLYADIEPASLSATSGVVINDNTTSNRIRLATASTSDQGLITANGSAQATLDGGTPAANTSMLLAMAYDTDDFALSLDGATAATDSGGIVPVVSQLQIGAETTNIGNMTIKQFAYYPIRLADATLESITT